jgi:hypothetical protein
MSRRITPARKWIRPTTLSEDPPFRAGASLPHCHTSGESPRWSTTTDIRLADGRISSISQVVSSVSCRRLLSFWASFSAIHEQLQRFWRDIHKAREHPRLEYIGTSETLDAGNSGHEAGPDIVSGDSGRCKYGKVTTGQDCYCGRSEPDRRQKANRQ